ncbi:hypothetical protein ACLB2K_037186 [Fragaria x ananassa]
MDNLNSRPVERLRRALVHLSVTPPSADVSKDQPSSSVNLGHRLVSDSKVLKGDDSNNQRIAAPHEFIIFASSVSPPHFSKVVDFIIFKIKYHVSDLTSKKLLFSTEVFSKILWATVFYLQKNECLASALIRLFRRPDSISGFSALEDLCKNVGKLVYFYSLLEKKHHLGVPLLELDMFKCGCKHEELAFSRTVMFRWLRPAPGWFKLNTDGSMKYTKCLIDGSMKYTEFLIGGGGVIRDSDGNWVHVFIAPIGTGSVLEAEARALSIGLTIATEIGITNLEIETDSYTLVLQMKNSNVSFV